MLHGSCRNPHHYSEDALVQGDKLMAKSVCEKRPQAAIKFMLTWLGDAAGYPQLIDFGIYRGERLITLSQQVQDDDAWCSEIAPYAMAKALEVALGYGCAATSRTLMVSKCQPLSILKNSWRFTY